MDLGDHGEANLSAQAGNTFVEAVGTADSVVAPLLEVRYGLVLRFSSPQGGLEGPGHLPEPCSALRPGSLAIARIRQ